MSSERLSSKVRTLGSILSLWFSARDIDLLTHGPQPRHATSQISRRWLQVEFTRLIGESIPSAELCRQRFQSAIRATAPGEPRYLLILDNLETFDSIVQIQHFLDRYVALPSKVILTSRWLFDDFQGDLRLPVGGLTKDQASTLLVREARRLYCEPRMTAQVQERLFTTTGGRASTMHLNLLPHRLPRTLAVDHIVRATLAS